MKLTKGADTPRKLDPSCPLAVLPSLSYASAYDIIQKTQSERYPGTTGDQHSRLVFPQVNAASAVWAIQHHLNRHFQRVIGVFLWRKSLDLRDALIRKRV
jgi:hypothetical protein